MVQGAFSMEYAEDFQHDLKILQHTGMGLKFLAYSSVLIYICWCWCINA